MVSLLALLVLGAGGYLIYRVMHPGPPALKVEDPELDKLNQVLEHFKSGDFEIVVDGNYRKPEQMVVWARGFIRRNYTPGQDTARIWITDHCYKTDQGNILYFKYPDGKTIPMRDIFLADLDAIEGNSVVESKPDASAP